MNPESLRNHFQRTPEEIIEVLRNYRIKTAQAADRLEAAHRRNDGYNELFRALSIFQQETETAFFRVFDASRRAPATHADGVPTDIYDIESYDIGNRVIIATDQHRGQHATVTEVTETEVHIRTDGGEDIRLPSRSLRFAPQN